MEYRSEAVCHLMIEEIWRAFEYGLKVKQLIQKIPQYYVATIEKMSYEAVFSGELPQPRKEIVAFQDPDPVNIPLDQNSNFRIEPEPLEEMQVRSQLTEEPHQANGMTTRRTKKPFNDTVTTDKEFFALSEPILPPQEIKLEEEIEKVKKQLYFGRKLRRENEEEERLRLQEHNNRKLLDLPDKDYAFDFSGDLIKIQKSTFKKHLISPTGGKSMDLTEELKKKNVLNQEEDNRDYLISRGQSISRQGKRLLFANMNKRQISHLPFIKLNENVKLYQNSRGSTGSDSNKFTLKSYQSKGESTFRHYSEIQKQKAERLYSLKKSSQVTELTEEEIQPIQVAFSPKKQSKRMQKYLKKLCEDRNKDFVSEINKSCNFDRLNSPHEYSVHRYYRHNFDSDKKSICESSLASLKLNSSFLREVKFTQ